MWDADSPKLSTLAASLMSQLWFSELAASWVGTREQCTRNRGSLHMAEGSAGIWGTERTSCSCQVYLGAAARGYRAAGTLEGQRDHLSAIEIWGAHGGLMECLQGPLS